MERSTTSQGLPLAGKSKRRLLRLERRLFVDMGCDTSVAHLARAIPPVEVDSSPPSKLA